jgi:hypothetical protein
MADIFQMNVASGPASWFRRAQLATLGVVGPVDGFDKHQAAGEAGESAEGDGGFFASKGDALEAFEFAHRLLDPCPELVELLRKEAPPLL